MGYRHDMSGESERDVLFPEGWRDFEILDCVEHTSKQGNEGFKFIFADLETGHKKEIYAIAVQGKRWFLKQILTACGVSAGEDGIYDWDIPNVIGKTVQGKVVQFEDKWINREGNEVITMKCKVSEVKAFTTKQDSQ